MAAHIRFFHRHEAVIRVGPHCSGPFGLSDQADSDASSNAFYSLFTIVACRVYGIWKECGSVINSNESKNGMLVIKTIHAYHSTKG